MSEQMIKDLVYKVIVIDDEQDLYEDYIEKIEKRLKEEGYILEHDRYEEMSDIEQNPLNDVDLFLVDLKFGKDDKGPQFIRKIREKYFTDILFYSSDSKAIQENRKSGEYQGVFFAIRDENIDEISVMIDMLVSKMIKRSNTPLATRGIVLGCIAELDNIIKEKINKLLEFIDEEKKNILLTECLRLFFDSYKSSQKKLEEFFGYEFHKGIKSWPEIKECCETFELPNLITNVHLTDSNKNLRILLKTYEKINGKDDTYQQVQDFIEMLNDRNVFAHVREELNEQGEYQFQKLNGDDYLILSTDKCKEIRTLIIKYCNLLNNIEKMCV